MTIKNIIIITKDSSDDIIELAKKIKSFIELNKYQYHTTIYLDMCVPKNPVADFVITIGGDGTILKTIKDIGTQLPIVGINMGGVGFLADIEKDDAISTIDQILKSFEINERIRIDMSIVNTLILDTALNEIAISNFKPGKLLDFSIIIDDVETQQFRADGIIISTPTGSTAYAMSAGGPIIDPLIRGLLIVPVAPYLLSSRPQVISDHHDVRILLKGNEHGSVVIDGQPLYNLSPGDELAVRISDNPAKFIDVGKNFFITVGKKLKR